MTAAFLRAASTWDKTRDGDPLIDYSDQEPGERLGKHRSSIRVKHFKKIICDTLMKAKNEDGEFINFCVMLEIKDKDASALKCLEIFLKGAQERELPVLEEDAEEEEVNQEVEETEAPKKKRKSKTTKAAKKKK